MALSPAHANAILDAIGGGTTVASATYISLHTGDPGTTGATEESGGSYARVQVNQDGSTSPYWNAASGASMDVNAAVTFPQGGNNDVVAYFGVWDAASAGNFLRGGALTASFTYGSTVTPQFAAGSLTLSES